MSLNTLEVLLNAERTLLDPTEPYDHDAWPSCTCGHIYHGVNGEYGSSAKVQTSNPNDPYYDVLVEIIDLLDLNEKIPYGKGEYAEGPYDLVSDYTELLATDNIRGESDGGTERHHALAVIQEAIAEIRKRDNAAMMKVIDAHTYEVV